MHTTMRTIADTAGVRKLIDALADGVARDIADSPDRANWALVGIRSRGDDVARRLASKLPAEALAGRVGSLDITLYRDDLSEIGGHAVVRTTEIPFAIDGLNVVLVDDVLMSGRSARAALQSLMDLGRPRRVWYCVLVDRGGRELPIAADHVALDLREPGPGVPAVAADEVVEVHLTPTDPCDEIAVRVRQPVSVKA